MIKRKNLKFVTNLGIYSLITFWVSSTTSIVMAAEKVSFGTGWRSTNNIVVTNHHVVAGYDSITLIDHKKQIVSATLIKSDKLSDLALLKISKSVSATELPIATNNAQTGEQVFTMGFPHVNIMGLTPKLTTGIISAKSGVADDPRTYQISVPLQAGNSGGPLLNMKGEVIGVTTAKLSAEKVFNWTGDFPQNVNYAIKHNYLTALIDTLDLIESPFPAGTASKQELKNLARKVETSIFIVVAHQGQFSKEMFKQSDVEGDFPLDKGINYSVSLFAYAEPGNYDIQEGDENSNTIQQYSKNVSKMVEAQIQLKSNKKIAVFHNTSGEAARSAVYNSDKSQSNKKLCIDNNDDLLVFSLTEANPGANFRYVTYLMHDCHSEKIYKQDYVIEREIFYDNFAYEHQLRSSLNEFIRDIPPTVRWIN